MSKDAKVPDSLQEEINDLVHTATTWSFNRRKFIETGAKGIIGAVGLAAVGCKTTSARSTAKGGLDSEPRSVRIEYIKYQAGTPTVGVIMVTGKSIYYDYNKVVMKDPKVAITFAPGTGDFKFQVVAHASAAASLVKYYLDNDPYNVLFPELFDSQAENGLFRPKFGPVIAYRHGDVIDILDRPGFFTVDPYGGNMSISTSGNSMHGKTQPPDMRSMIPEDDQADYIPQWNPGAKGAMFSQPDGKNSYYSHYMLGVDKDDLYIPDSRIARHVVKKEDVAMLRPMIRKICEQLVSDIKPGSDFDFVATIGRNAPLEVIMQYLGLAWFEKGASGTGDWQFSQNGVELKGGEEFEVPQALQNRFNFAKIVRRNGKLMSIVPTRELAYTWIRDNFRMIFNNFGNNPDFQSRGMEANERLIAWSAFIIETFKDRMQKGVAVPDTMITRLIKLQLDAANDKPLYAAMFGCTEADLMVRLGDDRIQVNSFGAFVGAAANPEEANGRIVEAVLRLKSGKIKAINGSFNDAVTAAKNDDAVALNKYIRELLRLNPQGEVLIRKCITETKLRSGEPIPRGTTVFAAHGAAMRDAGVMDNPNDFDINRDDKPKKYSYVRNDKNAPDTYLADVRENDDPQSTIYLHHGFGRHKCLGRYASEITMEEVLRATLRLGDVDAVDEKMTMDNENLYSVSFKLHVNT
jgi:cytochrome P450